MKQFLKFALAAFLSVSALCACNKEVLTTDNADEGKSLVFTATISEPLTRTTIENGETTSKVYWEDGDLIAVNGVLFKATPDSKNPKKATFTKSDVKDDPAPINGKYIACYPAGSYDFTQDRLRLGSVIDQNGESDIAYVPMYAESEDESLEFKNVFALFEFKLKGDATVKSIKVTYNPGETAKWFAGGFSIEDNVAKIDINYDEGGDNPQYEPSGSITLDCGTAALTAEGKLFYIPVPAMTCKFKFEIRNSEGKIFTKITKSAVTVSANKLYAFDWTPDFSAEELVAVDLGLRSGVKWASMNLGANHPQEYGDYFAWGEKYPKREYLSTNYRTDGLYEDAATVNLGGDWRIPTKEDFEELMDKDNCTWAAETVGGVQCVRITSLYNGNSIILPLSGKKSGSTSMWMYAGFYSCATPNTDSPTYPYVLDVDGASPVHKYLRANTTSGSSVSVRDGLAVRPVYGIAADSGDAPLPPVE